MAALALGVLPASAGAAGIHYTHESMSALDAQIAAHQVQTAKFNKKAHTVHVRLNDGRHVLASYPSHNANQLAAQLTAAGAAVTLPPKPKAKPVHHRLRYIAGGILIALIVIVAVVLGLNRRRPQEAAVGARAGSDVGAGGAPPAEPGETAGVGASSSAISSAESGPGAD